MEDSLKVSLFLAIFPKKSYLFQVKKTEEVLTLLLLT